MTKSSKKKIISALLSLTVFISALSGCNTDTPAETEETSVSSSETEPVSTTTTTSATTTASSAEIQEEPVKLLENRVRNPESCIESIVPMTLDGKCVDTESEFLISSELPMELETIKNLLRVNPPVDFELKSHEKAGYMLSFTEELPQGALVRFDEVNADGDINESWAFQTNEDFRVKSTYPADGTDSVYSNTGIEIEFSNPVSAENANKYFEITPTLKGIFETHRNTLYFIPEEEMKPMTTYTVTLKSGLTCDEGGALSEDFSFHFRTSQHRDGDYFFTNFGPAETFLEGDPAVIEIYCSNNLKKKDFDLKLYEFDTSEKYYDALKGYTESDCWYNDYQIDVTGMNEIFSSCEPPQPGLVDWRPLYIMLPDDLTEGYYVADISVGELSAQYFIQVNPISVYALNLGEECSFFINDTKTGKPAKGAKVTVTLNKNTYTATVDSNGIADIKTSGEEYGKGILEINYNGSRYIDNYNIHNSYEAEADELYYMYLYTDREAYLTTDTVKVWGTILPRRNGTKIPENLSLCFGASETEGEIKPIAVAPDGTFSSEFSFSNHSETYVRLTLLDGDTAIDSKHIRIKDYVKPDYVFDVSLPEYAVMPHKNPVNAEISATFYEGTPAKGLIFESYGATSVTPKRPITDADGKADISLLFSAAPTWRMCHEYHRLTLDGIENEYGVCYDYFYAFYRDVMLEKEYDKDIRTLTLKTSMMDFDKLPQFFNDGGYDYSILKSTPFDTKVTITITHHWWEKVESGTYYDYINKVTVKNYNYNKREETVGTYTVDTKNGVGILSDLPLTSDEGWYYLDIEYADSLNQLVEDGFSVNNRNYVSYWEIQSKYLTYTLDPFPEDEEDYRTTFTENEAIPFALKCNGYTVKENGKVFFAAYQNDFMDKKVYNTTDISYKTDVDNLPCFLYEGAYFDGRHVYPIQPNYLYFDPKEREITFEITTDKEYYDAGDTVQLTVRAVDKKGNPVNGATVSLSVVDEAAFAIMDQEVDILSDIYEYVWYNSASSYQSYIQHVLDDSGLGEKGGGDGDNAVRKDFKDTAYFGSQVTGTDGTTVFTFDLADNLTTWRATVQAIKEYETGRVLAGDSKHPIISTRPLFVTPIMLSTFIEGDDIAVTAKCQGLEPTDKITINISGNGVDETLYASSSETVNFGKLPMGEYKVLFSAEKNGNRDAVELPLTVTDTVLEAEIRKDFDLSEGIDITPTKWPVHLAFFDKEYMFYTEILRNLRYYGGDRLDMRVASKFASLEFGYTDEENFKNAFISETYDGFAKLMPNSDRDIELTALLCAAAPEIINRSTVVSSFDAVASSRNSDAEDISVAYMGLAALGEPVLEEIKLLLENYGDSFDYYGKMRLVAGLALCGDYSNAYKYYLEFTPEIVLNDNDPENIKAYVEGGDAEKQERTKLALITASILNLPEAEYFARYLVNSIPAYDSYSLELMVYLRNYIPDIEGDAIFTYNINGRTETVELNRHRGYYMTFGEEQFKNADFKVVSGAVYVIADYEARISEQSEPQKLKVTKTMSGKLAPGETIKVTVKVTEEGGSWPYHYNIEDVIPSCGRFVDKGWFEDDCVNRSGQKVTLWTDDGGTAVYYFRIATSGEFVLESAVAQDYDGDWGKSERTTVTVETTDEAM